MIVSNIFLASSGFTFSFFVISSFALKISASLSGWYLTTLFFFLYSATFGMKDILSARIVRSAVSSRSRCSRISFNSILLVVG